jgi:hypothetical protein
VQLSRGRQHRRFDPGLIETLRQVHGPVTDTPLDRQFFSIGRVATGQRHHLDTLYPVNSREVFLGDGPFARHHDLHSDLVS